MHRLYSTWTIVVPAYLSKARRRGALALLVGLAACLAAPRAARGEAAEPMRLGDVLDIARHDNPQIQAARHRASGMQAVPARVSAYDDPTLSWESWNFPDSWRIDQADNNIFRLSQKIPFPGKRTLAGTVAEREADVAQEDVRVVELEVSTDVKRAFADLWMTHEKLAILSRDKVLVERFARVAEQKYGVNQASQSDALRAQVELTHMVIGVNTAALAIDTASAELNALLSRAPDEPLGVPEEPAMRAVDAKLDTLISLALEQRPELAAQHAAIAREESAVELARLNWRPDFEFSLGRFVNYGANDGFGAIASVTLPFVYGGKYEAETAEAKARLASAESNRRLLEDQVRRQVAQAYARVRTASQQHDLAVSTHIPQAEQALRVTESAYQAGMVDFLSLIDTVRGIESVHVQHVEAQADFAKAYADLERAVGGEVPGGHVALSSRR